MIFHRHVFCFFTAVFLCVFTLHAATFEAGLESVPYNSYESLSINWNSRIQDAVDTVSSAELIDDLETLVSYQTRFSYSPHSFLAAEWLKNELSSFGYETSFHEHDRAMSPNVAAEKYGIKTPEEIVLICAHFDTVTSQPMELAPGANKNGSGTAALLSIARALADMHFDRTIRFVAFSGAEQGLRGSRVYSQRSKMQNENIVAVINLDMIGHAWNDTDQIQIVSNFVSEPLADIFVSCSELYSSLNTEKIVNSSVTWSDHASFWEREFPAILATHDHLHQYPYYHSIEDTVDKIEPDYLEQATKTATAAMAHAAYPRTDLVYIFNATLDDSASNGDGFMNPDETVEIWVDIMNASEEPSGPMQINLLCLAGSRYVNVVNGMAQLPELQPGEQTNNRSDPFIVQVHSDVPDFTQLTAIATLMCDAPHSAGFIFHEIITTYEWNDSIVLYDMTDNPEWSKGDGWEWKKPAGQGGYNYGWPNPASGYSGENVLGTWPDGDYQPNISTAVTSPVLDFSDIRLAELHFQRWLNVEKPAFDRARIWIINDDEEHLAWENPHEITDNQWHEMKIDIASYADGHENIQIRFTLDTDDKWEYSGWNLDDIRIAGLTVPPTDTMPDIPDNSIGLHLSMAETVLNAGDQFLLDLLYWNTTQDDLYDIPLFVVLDIDGIFWFWPEWESSMDYASKNLSAGWISERETLLNFVWPDIDGHNAGLRFLAAFTNPDMSDLLGELAVIEWEYN
jgi:hypothetical protein